MRKHFFFSLSFLLIGLLMGLLQAQPAPQPPLQWKLGPRQGLVLKGSTAAQLWVRQAWLNPGTLDANGQPHTISPDLGIRRARVSLSAQYRRTTAYLQAGYNNQHISPGTFVWSRPVIHDAYLEHALYTSDRASLYLGAGHHYWGGVSRITSASYRSTTTLDLPGFNLPNVNRTDRMGRQPGVFAHGSLGRIDYRFNLNKPYVFDQSDKATDTRAVNIATSTWSTAGYAAWALLDRETYSTAFFTNSYLGRKRILNIGAGYYYHPDASGTAGPAGIVPHDQMIWAVDAFLDLPMPRRAALTAYATWQRLDYGPGYYRSSSVMNYFSDTDGRLALLDGPGLGEPGIGTGSIFYAQAGYLLPTRREQPHLRLMPFGAIHYKDLDYLDAPAIRYDAGIHLLPAFDKLRFAVQYTARPVIVQPGRAHYGYRGHVILQTQFIL